VNANSVSYLGIHLLGEKLSFSIWIPAPLVAKKWKFAICRYFRLLLKTWENAMSSKHSLRRALLTTVTEI
jgi:hypothetical protein